jgi:hypothetical protein
MLLCHTFAVGWYERLSTASRTATALCHNRHKWNQPIRASSQLYVSSSSTLQSNPTVGGRSARDVTDNLIFSKTGRLSATLCLSV